MLHRRDAMIRFGLGGLTLSGLLGAGQATAARHVASKAKSCIYLFLWGGPPSRYVGHETRWRPGIRSQFQPIRTNIPGITICEHMPGLAKQMDKIAIVRSLSHPSNVHEPSVYYMMTGHQDPTLVVPRNHRNAATSPMSGQFRPISRHPATYPPASRCRAP